MDLTSAGGIRSRRVSAVRDRRAESFHAAHAVRGAVSHTPDVVAQPSRRFYTRNRRVASCSREPTSDSQTLCICLLFFTRAALDVALDARVPRGDLRCRSRARDRVSPFAAFLKFGFGLRVRCGFFPGSIGVFVWSWSVFTYGGRVRVGSVFERDGDSKRSGGFAFAGDAISSRCCLSAFVARLDTTLADCIVYCSHFFETFRLTGKRSRPPPKPPDINEMSSRARFLIIHFVDLKGIARILHRGDLIQQLYSRNTEKKINKSN